MSDPTKPAGEEQENHEVEEGSLDGPEVAGEEEEEVETGAGDPPADPDPDADAEVHGERGEGAAVIRLGSNPDADAPLTQREDFPNLVARVFSERGMKATGDSYAGHMRRFLTWCAARGLDVKSMPADTAQRYLDESYPNPVTRNQAGVALRSSLDVGVTHGYDFPRQEFVKSRPAPKPKEEKVGKKNGATSAHTVPVPSPFAPAPSAPAEATPAPTTLSERPATAIPRPTPVGGKNRGSVIPSLAGRVRITKRVDGTEGFPGTVPIGTIVHIGAYSSADVDGEGSAAEFITNHLREHYGPFYGGRPTVYYVDRLDNNGNPIAGATMQVPIMPPSEPTSGSRGLPPSALAAAQPAAPATPTGITGDRLLDFIVTETRRREEEANRRIEEIKGQATKQGMDPTMLMLLIDRVRPEPMDPAKIIAEAKKQGLIGRPEEDPFAMEPTPSRLPGRNPQPSGFDGFDLTPVTPREDPGMAAIAKMMEQQSAMMNNLLTTLLANASRPPPPLPPAAPGMDLASIIALAKSLAPTPAPESALGSKLMEAAIMKMLAPPEKPKSIPETLKEIMALREASEVLGGQPEEKPLSAAEVIVAAIENAPKIGEAVGNILANIPRAPTLKRPAPAAAQTVPAQTRAAAAQPGAQPAPKKTPAPPMPAEAQQAFVKLQSETDEQEIVNDIFAILTSYHGMQDPSGTWPLAAKKLMESFQKCDTRAEIRGVVTNLFVWSGAKRIMTEEIVERITQVLHAHYSEIFSAMTGGQEKKLADAEGAETPAEGTITAETGEEVQSDISYEESAAQDPGPVIV
jgi:hypothetical protein